MCHLETLWKNMNCHILCPSITWLSTRTAMSTNMSWSSRIEVSNLIMSWWRASISASVCRACCVSVTICAKKTARKACLEFSESFTKMNWLRMSMNVPLVWIQQRFPVLTYFPALHLLPVFQLLNKLNYALNSILLSKVFFIHVRKFMISLLISSCLWILPLHLSR